MAEHLGPHLQIIDLDAAHFVHIHVVAGGIECIGVKRFAEESGSAALADDVALL